MPKLDYEWKITPQFFLSAANLCAIVVGVGIVWGAARGDISNNALRIEEVKQANARSIERLEVELQRLRAQDTSIAVLKTDVQYIKDSIARIERAVSPTITR